MGFLMSLLKNILIFVLFMGSLQASSLPSFEKGNVIPFMSTLFEQAKKENRKIVLHVTAPWCPVCEVQGPIIAELAKAHPDFLFLRIDYDSSGPILRPLDVSLQATILIFKGEKEVTRFRNSVNKDEIETELKKVN